MHATHFMHLTIVILHYTFAPHRTIIEERYTRVRTELRRRPGRVSTSLAPVSRDFGTARWHLQENPSRIKWFYFYTYVRCFIPAFFSHLLINPKNVVYSRKVNLSFSALFAQVHENSDFCQTCHFQPHTPLNLFYKYNYIGL